MPPEGDKRQRTCETRARHDSDRAFSSSVMPTLLPSCNRCNCASSSICSHGPHWKGSLTRGGSGGMNPVRVSTSKSCAARVVVSTTPAGGPTRTSGRGRERKWSGGRRAIAPKVEWGMRYCRDQLISIWEGQAKIDAVTKSYTRERRRNDAEMMTKRREVVNWPARATNNHPVLLIMSRPACSDMWMTKGTCHRPKPVSAGRLGYCPLISNDVACSTTFEMPQRGFELDFSCNRPVAVFT